MPMQNFNPNSGQNNGNAGTAGTGGVGPVPYPMGPGEDDMDATAFLINYNKRYKNDAPTMFRETTIQQTLSCLIGKFKPNALLIGAAGVGKTKIVEDIARRLANDDPLIPDQLAGYTIWELPLSNIVAGSGLVGEVERKAKAVLAYAQDPQNKVILFIDEIHLLVGESQIYDKIAQIMKPALARGDMKVIGATTLQESQNLMDDPAFNRRFTRLIVDELSKEQTRTILDQMKLMMIEHYKDRVIINDATIDEVISVADEYKTIGSHRPDNAITLLDRTMADAYIKRKVLDEQAKNDPALAAALASMPMVILSRNQIKETAMKLITGNNKKTAVDMGMLKHNLERIKGQDKAIEYLLDTIERQDLGLNVEADNRPLTLLFAGNSGVGKTEVVNIIAKELTGMKPITLNMTEFHSSASINRIIGAPAGYIGSDSKTELPFDILESNPYQVVLLDEFEKADKSVQRLFMSAFDEGYIKTAKGKMVDFSKSIIIATTNAGHTGISASMGFTNTEPTGPSVTDLSRYFDTELLNRFTKIVEFNPITEAVFKEILADSYRRYVDKVKAAKSSYYFLPDKMEDTDIDHLTKDNYVREFGARPVQRIMKKYVEDLILSNRRGEPVGTATFVPTKNMQADSDPIDDGTDNDPTDGEALDPSAIE